jgi:hypothetical protein
MPAASKNRVAGGVLVLRKRPGSRVAGRDESPIVHAVPRQERVERRGHFAHAQIDRRFARNESAVGGRAVILIEAGSS